MTEQGFLAYPARRRYVKLKRVRRETTMFGLTFTS